MEHDKISKSYIYELEEMKFMKIIDKLKQIVGIQPKELPKESRIDNSEEKHKAIENAWKKVKKVKK